jgi:DNA (cytosine-5)-methyltransferase 1
VLLVGLRKDVVVPNEGESLDAVERGFLPKPVSDAAPSIEDLYSDLVDPNYCNGEATETYPSEARTKIQKQLRRSQDGIRIAQMGDGLTEHKYSKHSSGIVEKFRAMLASPTNEIPEQFRTKKFAQRVLPRTWSDKGPSITATSLPDDYVHYCQPRSLTVREWARLQMFPDWYQFAGKRTTGGLRRAGNPSEGVFDREVPKYTQIGNAVPVELARVVGQRLASMLQKPS